VVRHSVRNHRWLLTRDLKRREAAAASIAFTQILDCYTASLKNELG
jgi:hypothetical protein